MASVKGVGRVERGGSKYCHSAKWVVGLGVPYWSQSWGGSGCVSELRQN